MRADDARELAAALERLRALLRSPEVRAERNGAHDVALIEGFIPGREYAVKALMHQGELHVLAIFDKPDPLDGPFFEETIYLTPSRTSDVDQRGIVDGRRRRGGRDRARARSDPRRVPRQRRRCVRARSRGAADRRTVRAGTAFRRGFAGRLRSKNFCCGTRSAIARGDIGARRSPPA